MTTPRLVHAHEFFSALVKAGIFTEADGESIHRVVIDIKQGEFVMMYVEMLGDERVLGVATSLDGIQINEEY
jgi:hypothetical protein